MPRKLRVEYPGATYHVMSRGNRREDIFLNDVDRHNFIKTLAEACQKTGWQVHAYCLMRNHYHLLLETPNANLISERRMEARRLEEADREALRGLQRSWCLGDKEFKKEMLAKMEGKLGEHHSGELLHETAQAKSDWIVDEELRRLGWNEADLANRPRSDPAKLAIASRLRKETTLTIKASQPARTWARPKVPTPGCIVGWGKSPNLIRQSKSGNDSQKRSMLWVDPFFDVAAGF